LDEDPKLRAEVLDFIESVCEEADKAFGDIDGVLSGISSLSSDASEAQVMELHQELLGTYSRDKFKNVQKICDRLDELGRDFEAHIKPRLGSWAVDRGSQLFWLLEQHEGSFIHTIESALHDLSRQLAGYKQGSDLLPIRQDAAAVQSDLRDAVGEMRRIREGVEAMRPGGARRLLAWKEAADETLKRSPWFSGSFYAALLLALLASLTWISGALSFGRLVFVVTAALAGLTIVGAFQLRNDGRLSEAGFFRLIDLSFRRLFLPIARSGGE
jgi:hypothetical protein